MKEKNEMKREDMGWGGNRNGEKKEKKPKPQNIHAGSSFPAHVWTA